MTEQEQKEMERLKKENDSLKALNALIEKFNGNGKIGQMTEGLKNFMSTSKESLEKLAREQQAFMVPLAKKNGKNGATVSKISGGRILLQFETEELRDIFYDES